LEDICGEMRQVAVDARSAAAEESFELFRRISETDIRFHQTLIRAAGNRWVFRADENVVPISQMMRLQKLPSDANPRWAAARHYRIHTTILRIIRRGDATRTRAVMEAHVRCGNPLYEVERLQFPGGMLARRKEPGGRKRLSNT
jgi:DNA-binding GntR family transcriptional regulator